MSARKRDEPIVPLHEGIDLFSDKQVKAAAENGSMFPHRRLSLRGHDGGKLTDHSLKLLKQMPNLKELYLDSDAITEKGLETLRHVPQLELLKIQQCDLDFSKVDFTVLPNLKALHLIYASERDDVSFLSRLPDLEIFQWYAHDLRKMTKFPIMKNLRILEVHGDEIKSVEVIPFEELTALKTLRLEGESNQSKIYKRLRPRFSSETLFASDTVVIYRFVADDMYQRLIPRNGLPFPLDGRELWNDETLTYENFDFDFVIDDASKPAGDFYGFDHLAVCSYFAGNEILDRTFRGCIAGREDEDEFGVCIPVQGVQMSLLYPFGTEKYLRNNKQKVAHEQPLSEYQFKKSDLSHSIFRVPPTAGWEIFTSEGKWASESEFKAVYDLHNMTGLKFEKVWEAKR